MREPLVDMAEWPGLELVERLRGGHRNPVYRARLGGRDVVVRRSGRPADSLAWELDLVEHLSEHGVRVPLVVPAADGRRHVGTTLVQEFLPGGPPRDARDWHAVLDALRLVHEVGRGRPQRPGFASARRLLEVGTGGDVDLAAMPADAAAEVRAAWLPVLDGAETVVHGDPNDSNVLVDADGTVGLIDWDEARVDVPAFDLAGPYAELTEHGAGDQAWHVTVTAGVAWEAAACWRAEPVYAARRLKELRQRLSAGQPGRPGPGSR